jgi:hypothetical protein
VSDVAEATHSENVVGMFKLLAVETLVLLGPSGIFFQQSTAEMSFRREQQWFQGVVHLHAWLLSS